MRTLALLSLLSTLMLSTGCAYWAPVMPPQGLLFTSIKAPLDTDADSNPVGTKVGSASTTNILGLIAFGDASITSAARNGNLTKVEHIDYEFTNVFFLVQRFTVNAYGE